MSIKLDLYLRDQVIRGQVELVQGRPLDLLNSSLEASLVVRDAVAWSLHDGSGPLPLGTVRAHRDWVLVAVPHDGGSRIAAVLRSGWVEKRRVRVALGLGPLALQGTFHLGQWDQVSLEAICRGGDHRPFMPATDATIQGLYATSWSFECSTVLVARAQISYVSLLSEAGPGTHAARPGLSGVAAGPFGLAR